MSVGVQSRPLEFEHSSMGAQPALLDDDEQPLLVVVGVDVVVEGGVEVVVAGGVDDVVVVVELDGSLEVGPELVELLVLVLLVDALLVLVDVADVALEPSRPLPAYAAVAPSALIASVAVAMKIVVRSRMVIALSRGCLDSNVPLVGRFAQPPDSAD